MRRKVYRGMSQISDISEGFRNLFELFNTEIGADLLSLLNKL